MCHTVFNKYEFGSFMQLTNERAEFETHEWINKIERLNSDILISLFSNILQSWAECKWSSSLDQ